MARRLLFARVQKAIAAETGAPSVAALTPVSAHDDEALADGHMVSELFETPELWCE